VDVAPGSTYVPVSFALTVLASWALSVAVAPDARALDEAKPLHRSAEREIWDPNSNRIELFGKAVVRQPGETLSADYITVDMNARTLDARGNCVYVSPESVIYGEEMHFNMDTRTGTIINGRVANERFSLAGERINKLGQGRFQTHWGEYSTCVDCPQSWAFSAQDVDMEMGGYAHMSNVIGKVKDVPAFWLPYLIVPLKTERQTGFLFPLFAFGGINGFTFVQPFFWAINRSSDMTFGLGEYTARGTRFQWEGRYALSPRSGGQASAFYVRDRTAEGKDNRRVHRFGVDIAQTQELPFGIQEKLRLREVGDNAYPIEIGDVSWTGDPYLESAMSFSFGSPYFQGFVGGRRLRNLVVSDLNRFDQRTVQVLPTAVVTTNDRFIGSWAGGRWSGGFTLGVTNFTRGAGPFDFNPLVGIPSDGQFRPGIDPIREATRLAISPAIYTTFRPWDVVSVVPSIQYRGYAYTFNGFVPNLYRQYTLFQVDVSTQLERVYETSNPDQPRVKHLIRPLLTYSLIPEFLRQEPAEHPFIRQTERPGLRFDNYDLVPLDANPANFNFIPLGHSVAVGLSTELIRRMGRVDSDEASYFKSVEFNVGQAFNIREYSDARLQDPIRSQRPPQPFSRFFSNLETNFNNRLSSSTTYYYYPYVPWFRHQLSTNLNYVFDRGIRQRVLDFDRSFSLNYTLNKVNVEDRRKGVSALTGTMRFSVSDYFLPSLSAAYDFTTASYQSATLGLLFQSPSRCWRFSVDVAYTRNVGLPTWAPNLTLNLTGSGFGGVTEQLSSLGSQANQ
jgi:hypothetical protein